MRMIKLISIVCVISFMTLPGCSSKQAGDGSTDGGSSDDGTGSSDDGGDVGGDDSAGSLDFDAQGHAITLNWEGDSASYQRVVITQGDVVHSFDGSGGTQVTVEPGAWGNPTYNDLSAGTASYRIESAPDAGFGSPTVLEEGSVELIEHFTHSFDDLFLGGVDISGFANRAAVGESVTFQGKVSQQAIKGELYVAKPSVGVELVSLSQESTLTEGENFSFAYTFEESGMYVFELSGTNGIPQGAWPVYVGTAIPLAVQELDKEYPDPRSEPLPLVDMRAETIKLVNEMRTGAGLGELVTHSLLDKSAELKCAHMNKNKYFGHSFGGKKPADFAREAGVASPDVNEQLVVENTARRAFWFLYWSPLHRYGMLKGKWKSMGSAAAVAAFDSYQRLVFTYHLSTETP